MRFVRDVTTIFSLQYDKMQAEKGFKQDEVS